MIEKNKVLDKNVVTYEKKKKKELKIFVLSLSKLLLIDRIFFFFLGKSFLKILRWRLIQYNYLKLLYIEVIKIFYVDQNYDIIS